MKNFKRYRYYIIVLIITSFLPLNSCYASISSDFKFVIDTIGIPEYNVYGDEINKEIYYVYNIFVYANPNRLQGQVSQQRFKAVPNLGKWTLEGGKYTGIGTQGEFNILGKSYSGSLVYNVYFPVDAIPETTPDKWNFVSMYGAYESWNDDSKYKYIEQLNFMKNTNLLFDKLDFINNTANPYDLVEYNISASKIGLDKAMLNTSSTWKTMGIITVKRINNKGMLRDATFATPKMAASANVKSNIQIENRYIMPKDENSITIPIKFSASAINLTNYANEKHIKEICSILYINGKEAGRVSGSKTVNVDKNINFTVSRIEYESPNPYPIQIKVLSYLYTEFSVDGLMQDVLEKNITLEVEPKEIKPINEISLGILKKQTTTNPWVVSPLVQTLETNNANSVGMIEAGRHIALKLKLDIKNEQIEDMKIYINDNIADSNVIIKKEKNIVLDILVPINLTNTLKSWDYLRSIIGNYFNIKFEDVGKRIKGPNILKIELIVQNLKYVEEIRFDSIDDYTKNINYIFNNSVTNKEKVNIIKTVEDWICE